MMTMSESGDEMYIHSTPTPPRRRGCGCLGCLGRLFIAILATTILGLLFTWVTLFVFPPFGRERVARVLFVGLDEPDRLHPLTMPRRSDAVILMAVPLNGSGATMLAVPRDARVHIPGVRGWRKINAAYPIGKVPLLRKTLAQESTLSAQLPHYLVFSSITLKTMVDAVNGVRVDVPFDMDYDDNWGNLHIHLKKGAQVLNGEQAVGYVRWRKNNSGKHKAGTDFERSERQQEVLKAIAKKLMTVQGIFKTPTVYKKFRANTQSNLTFRQLVILGLNFKDVNAQAVPGDAVTRRGVSYVECDWDAGRAMWKKAIR